MPLGLVDTVGGDLPLPVGGGVSVGVAPSDVDVMIDNTPFWLSITADSPYSRETAQFQRDQVDQQPEAGEQSLAGWWTRSQMSFHYGAGLTYLDTLARPQPEDRLRFHDSRNVDCWTPGTLLPLNRGTLDRAVSPAEKVWIVPTTTGIVYACDTKVEVYDGATWTTLDYGSTFPIKAFATDGASYYAATVDGVWTGSLAGGATGTKLWNLPGTSLPMCLGWVKQRLMLGHGAAVYSLDGTGPALPTAQYTHPVSTWAWTAFSDGPGGILACGYAGLNGGVFTFALTDVSGTPTLGAGVSLITLPSGERPLSSIFYLGSLLILGTNRGVRVCPFNSYYGTASLGPLSYVSTDDVTALGGYDRYVFGGTLRAGETMLVRLDLGAPLDDAGHYAWAPDMVMPDYGTWTTAPTSITFDTDGAKWVGVTGRGVVHEQLADPDTAEATWLETARIRMGTVEHKNWAYITLRGSFTNGPVGISARVENDTDWESIYVTSTSEDRFATRKPPSEWLQLRFDLTGESVISSYQVQALPGGTRQRLVQLPVKVFDYETTRSGVQVGYDGWARERLQLVEKLEGSGAELTVAAPALFPEAIIGVIEKLTYVQVSDPGDRGDGTGGLLQLAIRTTGSTS